MIQKQLKEDAEIQLKSIIKNRLSIDIDKAKRRLRDNVVAKMIYTSVLRDEGYTWMSIAKSINRDHSTIIYQYNTLKNLVKFDKKIERQLVEIKTDFLSGDNFLQGQTTLDLKNKIINLISDNKILILRIEELEKKK